MILATGIIFTCTAENIKPFSSDGCSSFPDGTIKEKVLWLECCILHDKAYWQGGTKQQRLYADVELKQCVSSVGKPIIAKLMLTGVRVGGSPYWPTAYRWGYGWEFPKAYGILSKKEIQQVQEQWAIYLNQSKK